MKGSNRDEIGPHHRLRNGFRDLRIAILFFVADEVRFDGAAAMPFRDNGNRAETSRTNGCPYGRHRMAVLGVSDIVKPIWIE